MKEWKTIAVTAVIALLVVALVLVGTRQLVSPEERAASKRIADYEVVAKEQRLITEILTLKMDAAIIQSKFQQAQQRTQQQIPVPPAPRQQVEIPELGIEGEFIPLDQLPPEAR